jgi:microsomal dipeptidase-like Zn-dependent dipeptidase
MKWTIRALAVLLIIAAVAMYLAPGLVENRQNHTLELPPYRVSPGAQELHQRMTIADLHADSLLWNRNLLRRGTRGHVDLPRLEEGNVSLLAFTVVTQSPRNLNIERNSNSSDLIRYLAIAEGWPIRTWNSYKQRALYKADQLREVADQSNGELVLIRTRRDLRGFLAARGNSHRVGAWLGMEGAQPLEGNLASLDEFYAVGYRMISPAHFTDTEIGGSAAGVQKGGLTPLGRQWVHAMEAKGMIIDLAHASHKTLLEVTSIATKPVVVSHTGVRGTCDNNRNLSDEELRAVANTGGVIGIGYWDTATCGKDAKAIVNAIQYARGVVGIEHIALGSDYDGAIDAPFDVTGVPLITEELMKQGFSEREIRLVMGENVVRVLSQTLPE